VSLQCYPHEDLHVKPAVRPDVGSAEFEAGAGDYFAIAVINLTLAMAFVSFALNGGIIGTLAVLGLIGAFNGVVLRGMSLIRRNSPAAAAGARAQPQSTSIISRRTVSRPQREGGRGQRDDRETANPEQSRSPGYSGKAFHNLPRDGFAERRAPSLMTTADRGRSR
jgi:hypothetical protein